MRIAVFSDVHANEAALEAVLADIERTGVDLVHCAGDMVGFGPRPAQVLDRIREAGIPSVRGNHEVDVLAERSRSAASGRNHIRWTAGVLRKRHRRDIKRMPFHRDVDVDGSRMLLLHGSPRGVHDYVFPSLTTRSLDGFFPPELERPDVLVSGHTHMPFTRRVGGMLVVNAGSVGRPMDGDTRSSWALIEASGGRVRARILRVDYPVDETLRAMKKAGLAKDLIKSLRCAMRRWPPGFDGRLW